MDRFRRQFREQKRRENSPEAENITKRKTLQNTGRGSKNQGSGFQKTKKNYQTKSSANIDMEATAAMLEDYEHVHAGHETISGKDMKQALEEHENQLNLKLKRMETNSVDNFLKQEEFLKEKLNNLEKGLGVKLNQITIQRITIAVGDHDLGAYLPLGHHLANINQMQNYWYGENPLKENEEICLTLEVDGINMDKKIEHEELEIAIHSQGRRLKINNDVKQNVTVTDDGKLQCKVPWLKSHDAANDPDLSQWGSLEGGEILHVQVLLVPKSGTNAKITSDKYEIVALPAPIIDSMDPNEGPAGTTRQHVTIRGRNFDMAGPVQVLLYSSTSNQIGNGDYLGEMIGGYSIHAKDVNGDEVTNAGRLVEIDLPPLNKDKVQM